MKDVRAIKEESGNIKTIYKSEDGLYVNLMTSKDRLSNSNEKLRLIKKTEGIIRKSERYKTYKNKLMSSGLNMCAVMGNITTDNAKIEMHHGPIFTLWDYVEITIMYFYRNNLPISTFRIADQILNDHFDDLIQVVMLSESVHKAVHNNAKSVEIPLKSVWGDLRAYLEKYKGCFDYKHFAKLNSYLKLPQDNTDYSLFESKITTWKNIAIPKELPKLADLRKK